MKNIFFFAVLFIFSTGIQGQQFRGGIIAGLNACQVDGDNYAGFNKLGFEVGAYVYRPVSVKIDLQLEIKYMGKGARKITSDYDMVQYRSQLHYIELPVLLHYKATPKVGLEGGLAFGYLFSYAEKDEYGNLPEQDAVHFKAFELSGVIGVRYQIKPRISAHLRYSYSILPVLNHPGNLTYHFNLGANNNLFSIGILYEIGKQKQGE